MLRHRADGALPKGLYLSLVASCAALAATFSPPSAQAADAAPGQPPAGAGATVMNPSLDLDYGNIAIRKVPVDLQLGAGASDSAPGKVGQIKASAGHTILLFGSESPGFKIGTFRIGLGAEGEVKLTQSESGKTEVQSWSLKSPSVGFFGVVGHSTYTPAVWKGEQVYQCNDPKISGSPHCAVRKDPKTGEAQVVAIQPEVKIPAAGSLELVSILYEAKTNKPIGLKINSAVIEYLKLHGQVAFTVGGVNMDLCAGVKGTVHVGEVKIGERAIPSAVPGIHATACAGIQLGSLGNLRDEVVMQYMGVGNETVLPSPAGDATKPAQRISWSPTTYGSVTNTLRVDKVLDTPVGLYWEHSYETTQAGGAGTAFPGGGAVTTNTFGIAGRF